MSPGFLLDIQNERVRTLKRHLYRSLRGYGVVADDTVFDTCSERGGHELPLAHLCLTAIVCVQDLSAMCVTKLSSSNRYRMFALKICNVVNLYTVCWGQCPSGN